MIHLMETPKSCPKCRHFFAGNCRLNPPPYIAVSEDDWCGRFALVGAARGTPSKITDETVIGYVKASWMDTVHPESGRIALGSACRRASLIRELMEHGVSYTPALKRIEKLVSLGRLMSGNDPAGKQDGICVWPAEEDVEIKEPQRAGRPVAIGQDALAGMISELAPSKESAVSLRAVHRALEGRISLGALHAAVKELAASGRVVQDAAGVYSAMEVES